jgi:HEAT repeat protein/uncharacterized low-complexity protein
MTKLTSKLGAAALLLAVAGSASAQSLADRVAAVEDGQVRFSYTAREGVCGNGRNISTHRHSRDWESWCEPGPVRVAIDIRRGSIREIDTYVGGRWRERDDAFDLGMVPAPDAAAYLLSLANTERGDAAEDAIFPATIADSVEVWPDLLDLAKNERRPNDVREQAVFWVAQAAGEVVAGDLEEIAVDDETDRDVRESAVFALSQLEHESGVPALIRIVREHTDGHIRRQAVFWLGQSEDPRALALFEELLTRRP